MNSLGIAFTLPPPLLTSLRLAPLLSSTASLTHAYMERVTTTAFLNPPSTRSSLSRIFLASHTPPASPINTQAVTAAQENAIPVWFVNFFSTAVCSVISLNTLTLLSAAANLWVCPVGLEKARTLYHVGLGAALAHYGFVPLVRPSVERLFGLCAALEEGKGDGRGKSAVESVREWVGWHEMRMMTVDLVAWVSFAVGVVGVLTP